MYAYTYAGNMNNAYVYIHVYIYIYICIHIYTCVYGCFSKVWIPKPLVSSKCRHLDDLRFSISECSITYAHIICNYRQYTNAHIAIAFLPKSFRSGNMWAAVSTGSTVRLVRLIWIRWFVHSEVSLRGSFPRAAQIHIVCPKKVTDTTITLTKGLPTFTLFDLHQHTN